MSGKLGELLKQTAALSGVCYVFGFLILNASLSNLGAYDFSLASSRVLAAGFLYLTLGMLSGVGWIAVLLVSIQIKPLDQWSKKRLYMTLLLGWLAGGIAGGLFYWGLWSGLYGHGLSEVSGLWPWLLCNTAALVLLVAGGLYSLTGQGGLIWPALGLILLITALSLFGSNLYPQIPGALGGGAPLRVQLLVGAEPAAFLSYNGLGSRLLKRPDGGNSSEDWFLTAPVHLVDSGSDAYILRTLGSPPRALVLKKDNVQGLVHLR